MHGGCSEKKEKKKHVSVGMGWMYWFIALSFEDYPPVLLVSKIWYRQKLNCSVLRECSYTSIQVSYFLDTE